MRQSNLQSYSKSRPTILGNQDVNVAAIFTSPTRESQEKMPEGIHRPLQVETRVNVRARAKSQFSSNKKNSLTGKSDNEDLLRG